MTRQVVRVVMDRENINPRQQRFVVEYLKDGNGTGAAIRAGYATSSAAVDAHRLLNEWVLQQI
jgi:phage terminase small subunit